MVNLWPDKLKPQTELSREGTDLESKKSWLKIVLGSKIMCVPKKFGLQICLINKQIESKKNWGQHFLESIYLCDFRTFKGKKIELK